MDKNRIHIDDLVRSRLSGAEEKEPAGAWGSMRDLLDKELPVETAAFNWRRMLGYATAVILATSVSVGGYNYYRHAMTVPAAQSTIAKTSALSQPKNIGNYTATDVADLAAVAANSTHRTTKASNTNTRSAVSSNHLHFVQASRFNHQSSANIVAATADRVAPVKQGTIPTIQDPLATHQTATQPLSTAAIVASNSSDLSKPSAIINAAKELAADHPVSHAQAAAGLKSANSVSSLSNHSTRPAEVLVNAEPVNTTGANGTHTGNNNNNTPDEHQAALIPASSGAVGANENKQHFVLTKDTIRQIEIAYRRTAENNYRNPRYVRDTLAVTNVVIERRKPVEVAATQQPSNPIAVHQPSQPAPVKPVAFAHTAEMPVPQSAAVSYAEAVAAQDNIKLVSLSQFRVASRFNKLWNAERFQLMVQNVKADLSRAQFYAGITGGLNASLFTATAMAGFQAGLTGLLKFNEQWSIAGELKFYQRFNTGNSIKDNYIRISDWYQDPNDYTVTNGVRKYKTTWNQDSVSHSYNFTAVQTVEVPILLRYNIGRFFAEAGVNMMYAFAVNKDEINNPKGNSQAHVPMYLLPGAGNTSDETGNKPTISSSDFGSRFGLGYVLGVGYQLTPALQVNGRLVNSVWDNATSIGAGKVSQNLYQTPSIQFSVGYRFKQGKGR